MKKAFVFFLLLLESVLVHGQLLQERLYRINPVRTALNVSTLTSQGNVFLSGVIDKNPTLLGWQGMYLLVKPNIDTLWTRKGPVLINGGMGIKQAGNALFFAGSSRTGTTSNSDLVLEKLNLNGAQQFRKTISFSDIDDSGSLLIWPNKDLMIAGTGSLTKRFSRFVVTRFDSLGNIVRWQKDYDWSGSDAPVDMKFTKNGNIIILAFSYHNSFNRIKLMILDQNGDSVLGARPVISKVNQHDKAWSSYSCVTVLSDGGYLVTGSVDTLINSFPRYMGFVAKLNSNLQPVWRYIQRGKLSGHYYYTKNRELADGSLLALSFGANNQFYLSRFSATGSLLNTYTFTSTVANHVKAVTLEYLSADSSFIIGGEATVTPQPNYTSAFYVAKVKLPASVPQVLGTSPETGAAISFTLGQSYPNPATESAIIPFNLPNSYQQANILIRDITGRQVGDYAIKKHSSSLEVNLSNFSNGLYTYTLLVDEKPIATKKLSVIK